MTTAIPIALIDDYGFLARDLPVWQQLRSEFKLDVYDQLPSMQTLQPYPVLITIRERSIFTAERLAALPQLRHLALTGRASGQVDLAAAQARGITVSITAGSAATTAELTAAFILAHAKQLSVNHENVRNGKWQTVLGMELCGKTLGIIGLGRLGSKVADFGRCFGMDVLSWDSGRVSDYAAKHKIPRLTLKALLSRADFSSIHLRLNDNTRGLIGREELAAIPNGALFINTSRAPIVDDAALMQALQTGRFHAALDVYATEPLATDAALRQLPNVYHSPHTGYVTLETYNRFFSDVIENIHNVADGKPYKAVG